MFMSCYEINQLFRILKLNRKYEEQVGRREPLPPPCEIIEHDNAAMPHKRMKSRQSTDYNVPAEQVRFSLSCSILVYSKGTYI